MKRNYQTVITSEADEAERLEAQDRATVKIYTDGTLQDRQLGAAAVLYENNNQEPSKIIRYKLGTDTEYTTDDAEKVAGWLVCWILKTSTNHRGEETVSIYTDSQELINAMRTQTPKTGSHIITQVNEISNELARQHRNRDQVFTIRWIPAHGTSRGNRRADLEAKRAAKGRTTPSTDLPPQIEQAKLPISTKALKDTHLKSLHEEAAKRWNQSHRKERFERDVDDTYPYLKFRAQQTKLSRAQASLLMQIRTSHIPLNSYLHRFGRSETPRCQTCHENNRGNREETLKHYLFKCPTYRWERSEMDRKLGRDSRNLKALLSNTKGIKTLLKYIGQTGRITLYIGEVPINQRQNKG